MRIIIFLFAVSALFLGFRSPKMAKKKPNIIFIMSDDEGYNDKAYLKSLLGTEPKVDSVLDFLDNDCVKINNHNVQTNCTPTRVGLLSGIYPFKLGMNVRVCNPELLDYGLDVEEWMSEMLKRGGYEDQGFFGKVHVSDLNTPNYNTFPTRRGFNRFYGRFAGSANYFGDYSANGYHDLYDGETCIYSEIPDTTITHRITMEFGKWLNSVVKKQQKNDKPFFAYIPHFNPHKPYNPQLRSDARCTLCTGGATRRCIMMWDYMNALHYVIEECKRLGIMDNTIIVIGSDNGGISTECDSDEFNKPFRAHKGDLYDGGIVCDWRIYAPCLGLVGGTETDPQSPTHIVDWFATFAHIAGVTPKARIDGVNILPILKGGQQRDRVVVCDMVTGVKFAVKMGKYSLLNNPVTPVSQTTPQPENLELYDRLTDIGQTNNLINTGIPEQVALYTYAKMVEPLWLDLDPQDDPNYVPGNCAINE